MTPALERGLKKALRTLIQLAASGALTAAVNSLAGGMSPAVQSLVATAWMFVVTFAQNGLETAGHIPVLLPTAGIIPVAKAAGPVAADVAGTVSAVADTAGVVTGTVSDTAGDVVGDMSRLIIGKAHDDQGGVTAGLAAIVLCLGLLACGTNSAHSLGRVAPVTRDAGDCNREGNCNDQHRCQGDGCRGSFSPGPFDRSPVDIHDNQVCISPDCSSHNDKKGQS